MFKLLNKTPKKIMIRNKSYRPVNVKPETKGNKKTSSMSYNKKNTQINKNWIETFIIRCDWGLKPHS